VAIVGVGSLFALNGGDHAFANLKHQEAVLAAARASGLFAPLAYEGEYSPDANASRSRL